jgi:hypothetical protein
MPKKPIDYSKNINYKLVCNDLSVNYVYVGHTTNFKERKRCHKKNCYNENCKDYNYKVYQTIRENGGWDNWTMIEIEKYPCKDLNEATARERYWYEELNSNMNSNKPHRSKKEYYEENKEKLNEKKKEYREKNKEKINEKKKEYREKNKDYKKETDKLYYEKNKEKLKEKNKEWREQNKEKLNEKITCECGSIINREYLTKHKKKIKHQDFMNNQQGSLHQ